MMKTKKAPKITFILTVICAAALLLTACGSKKDDAKASLTGQRVRVVIGSTATNGDTYLTANTATRHLSQKLDFNGKVDPLNALKALEEITSAKPGGSTIMMFHDMTYLGVLFGIYDNKYALENYIVGPRMAISQGQCFAGSASAPYNTMVQMAEWLKANPNQTVRIAIQSGSISHLCFNTYYDWVLNKYGPEVATGIKALIAGSTDKQTQALWDGNCNAIFADISALDQYVSNDVDVKIRMKILGLMSGQRITNKPYPTFLEQGITFNGKPFTYDKDYNIFFPKDTPQSIIDEVDAAMAEIAQDPTYQKELEKLGFKAAYLSSKENKTHMYQKRKTAADLIKNAPSLDILTAQ